MRPTSAAGFTSPPLVGTQVMAIRRVRSSIMPLQGRRVEHALGVVGDDLDHRPGATGNLEEGHVVGGILGPRGQDPVTRPERGRKGVECHLPRDRGVLRDRDLVTASADQAGDAVIDAVEAGSRLRRGLVAADLRLPLQVARHRLEHGPRHQAGPGIVEVHAMRDARRLRPESFDVHAYRSTGAHRTCSMRCAPVASITSRSNPRAMPDAGGITARAASSSSSRG